MGLAAGGQGVKAPWLWVLETAIELYLPLDDHQDLGPVPLEAPQGEIAKEDKSESHEHHDYIEVTAPWRYTSVQKQCPQTPTTPPKTAPGCASASTAQQPISPIR
jgi:hypothetical protein